SQRTHSAITSPCAKLVTPYRARTSLRTTGASRSLHVEEACVVKIRVMSEAENQAKNEMCQDIYKALERHNHSGLEVEVPLNALVLVLAGLIVDNNLDPEAAKQALDHYVQYIKTQTNKSKHH